jgi:hypothetical protein
MVDTIWKLCGYINEHTPDAPIAQTAAFKRMLPPPEDAFGHIGTWTCNHTGTFLNRRHSVAMFPLDYPELDVVVLSDMRALWGSAELAAVWAGHRAAIRGGVVDAAAGFLNRMDEVGGHLICRIR